MSEAGLLGLGVCGCRRSKLCHCTRAKLSGSEIEWYGLIVYQAPGVSEITRFGLCPIHMSILPERSTFNVRSDMYSVQSNPVEQSN